VIQQLRPYDYHKVLSYRDKESRLEVGTRREMGGKREER